MKKYLFLVTEKYGFPILRPLQEAIRQRGGRTAWFFDNPEMRRYLRSDEEELRTAKEVIDYNPLAVFTAGNHMYHFFPGIKVQMFHGFNNYKRPDKFRMEEQYHMDDHFRIRGWFDIYCMNDLTATPGFTYLSEKLRTFKVYDTGWAKLDSFIPAGGVCVPPANEPPVIIYSSTFTKGITSTPYLFDEINRLVRERDWRWIITFHPMMDRETVDRYRGLEKFPNVTFYDGDDNIGIQKEADVMLCDSSSIIFEFMYLDKPVVTFRNTYPDDYLMDISDPALLEQSLETALSRPEDLMGRIRAEMDKRHPWRDGHSSERVLDAVDDFAANWQGKLKKKKASATRRWQARRKLGYYKHTRK